MDRIARFASNPSSPTFAATVKIQEDALPTIKVRRQTTFDLKSRLAPRRQTTIDIKSLATALDLNLQTPSNASFNQSVSAPCLPSLASQSKKAPRLHADPNKVWRSRELVAETKSLELPPLAKGMSRHRCPRNTFHQEVPSQPAVVPQLDAKKHTNAHIAALGSKILGRSSWKKVLFDAVDGSSDGVIMPAEFGSLISQFSAGIHNASKHFTFNFDDADKNSNGRISLSEWEAYAARIERTFGANRCLMAAWLFLGRRQIEPSRLIKNIWMLEGYSYEASVQLLTACSKWGSNSLFNLVSIALERNADPNASVTDSRYKGYTPLIFLSMAQSTVPGIQVETAIDALIAAGADVHRESGLMPFGKEVPLRFAAQFQNEGALRALLKRVHVGDIFNWAAGEHIETIMVEELRKVSSFETVEKIVRLSKYTTQASILLLMFASPFVAGRLTPLGAEKLMAGEFEDGNLRREPCEEPKRADPNAPGLDGTTALMHVVKDGDVETARALLEGRASPLQQDCDGTTPLHFAAMRLDTDMVELLLSAAAEPHMVDHAGLSALMLAGESRLGSDESRQNGTLGGIYELLKPERTAEEILQIANEDWEALLGPEGADPEALKRTLRLHESLFFDPLKVATCTSQGRTPRNHILARFADLIIEFLKVDPLEGEQKKFAKYLLEATMGPRRDTTCRHVSVPWSAEDNRIAYRERLMAEVACVLDVFAAECNAMRDEVNSIAGSCDVSACADLCALASDVITVPQSWQNSDPFWRTVQERQVLRYDPAWALGVSSSGARCCLALLRLGAVADLAQYSALIQVYHKPAEEFLAHGYVAYSELCNEPFQRRMCAIAARATQRHRLNVSFPQQVVGVKKLKRLCEKIRESKAERGMLEWPRRNKRYLSISHVFYILDTVRLTFVCRGDSIEEQADCCMKLVKEFEDCCMEEDRACSLRQKSGFAKGVESTGGYADVKLLVYADLGFYEAFDGTKIPLRIIGEVQLILEGYAKVKQRMHLAYEVARGSFDNYNDNSAPMVSLDAT